MADSTLTITMADPLSYSAICRMLSIELPPNRRQEQATRYYAMIVAGELDPDGIFAAKLDGELVGAILTQLTPGRGAVCLPPHVSAVPFRVRVELALAQAAVDYFRERGVKVSQMLLSPEARMSALPLERMGFRHITQLQFHCGSVKQLPPTKTNPSPALTFLPLMEPNDTFAATLFATYDGTHDCPELNGTRTAEEVIAGYDAAANGLYDGPGWVLVSQSDQPIGVLILSQPQPHTLDLGYLGLVPSARGRRFGNRLVQYVMERAANCECESVRLSFDARNRPAERLYARHGFQLVDTHDVFLWLG